LKFRKDRLEGKEREGEGGDRTTSEAVAIVQMEGDGT
jgi:hypothetical protein